MSFAYVRDHAIKPFLAQDVKKGMRMTLEEKERVVDILQKYYGYNGVEDETVLRAMEKEDHIINHVMPNTPTLGVRRFPITLLYSQTRRFLIVRVLIAGTLSSTWRGILVKRVRRPQGILPPRQPLLLPSGYLHVLYRRTKLSARQMLRLVF